MKETKKQGGKEGRQGELGENEKKRVEAEMRKIWKKEWKEKLEEWKRKKQCETRKQKFLAIQTWGWPWRTLLCICEETGKKAHFILHCTPSFMPVFLGTATSALSLHCFMTASLKSLLLADSQKHPRQLSPWPRSDQTRKAQHLLLLLIPVTFFLGSAHGAEGPTVSAELPS